MSATLPPMPGGDCARVRAAIANETRTEVILLRRSMSETHFPGYWNLPGGKVDAGESHESAIVREMLEESGLSAQMTGTAGPWISPRTWGTTFLMDRPSGALKLNEEHDAASWFPVTELPSQLLPGTLEALKYLLPDRQVRETGTSMGRPYEQATAQEQAQEIPVRLDADALTIANVFHCDRGGFTKPERTEEGYLKLDADASKVGVLEYRLKDGSIRRELVAPEHLFNADSMATFAQVPVTRLHPDDLLDARTARKHTRGWTGPQARRDGDKLAIACTITDADLIGDVEKGMREVSAGYRCDLVMQAGVWQGQRYDAIQTNRRYNHLAVVPRGRAGRDVRLRMDAAEQITQQDEKEEPTVEDVTIRIDGVDYKVAPHIAQAIQAEQRADAAKAEKLTADLTAATTRADKADEEAKDATTKAEQAQAKADAAEASLEKLKSERTDAALGEAITARLALLDQVRTVVPATTKLDASMPPRELQTAAIGVAFPTLKMDGKSDEYVATMFDAALVAGASLKPDPSKKAADALLAARQDAKGDEDKVADAKAKARKDAEEAWKQPIGTSR